VTTGISVRRGSSRSKVYDLTSLLVFKGLLSRPALLQEADLQPSVLVSNSLYEGRVALPFLAVVLMWLRFDSTPVRSTPQEDPRGPFALLLQVPYFVVEYRQLSFVVVLGASLGNLGLRHVQLGLAQLDD
jgi:hypothetical protein